MKKILEDALENVKKDRRAAEALLNETIEDIYENRANTDLKLAAAKYLSILQKSNDQLVALVSTLNKAVKKEDSSISNTDDIYSEIGNDLHASTRPAS